jgi:predicted ABC-type ATPase
MPDLYILTGSNGAGKSTAGRYYLPEYIRDNYEIFDGDKLFMQKRKQIYKIETPSLKEAKRLSEEWLHQHFENCVATAISHNDHFVYEGHFPDEENWITPKRFKSAGYKVHLIFLGLSHPAISELRVLDRARLGGHNVPPYEIERNFYGNLKQLNNLYHFIDELQVFDTSGSTSTKVLAIFKNGMVDYALPAKELPEWFQQRLPHLFQLIFINKNSLGLLEEE